MTTEALKSTPITNLDTVPVVANTTGEGGPGHLRSVNGYVTVSASMAAGSTYRLVRVPSAAKVKQVLFESEAQGAGAFNLSVYYSDSTVDGTQPVNQGVIVPTTGDQFFASDIDCSAAVVQQDKTNESGNYTLALRNKPLWSALGLTSDPGGFFDIVAVVHTTAVTTGTGKLGVCVNYVE
jgi:hypothetical protein